MILRNLDLRGPYPISRDGKALGEFIKQAVETNPTEPLLADVEIVHESSVRVEVRLKKLETVIIKPGFQVAVDPNRTFTVTTPDAQVAVKFVFPSR